MKDIEDQETERAQQKREQILDAARRLFLAHVSAGYYKPATEFRRSTAIFQRKYNVTYAESVLYFSEICR